MQSSKASLPSGLETEISFLEAMSVLGNQGDTIECFAFENESLNGEMLDKIEIKRCKFSSCRFGGTKMSKSWLSDCVFINCDFQSATFYDASIHNCSFINCRLTGAQIGGASVKNTEFCGCMGQYLNFSQSVISKTDFVDNEFDHIILNDTKLVKNKFKNSIFTNGEWLHTPLNGADLTSCNIDGGSFSIEAVKGVTVTAMQACELARLLQIIIK